MQSGQRGSVPARPSWLQLNLTGVASAKLELTEFYGVQIAMDTDSGAALEAYTGANVDKQIAFMRDGVVLHRRRSPPRSLARRFSCRVT